MDFIVYKTSRPCLNLSLNSGLYLIAFFDHSHSTEFHGNGQEDADKGRRNKKIAGAS